MIGIKQLFAWMDITAWVKWFQNMNAIKAKMGGGHVFYCRSSIDIGAFFIPIMFSLLNVLVIWVTSQVRLS